MEMMQVKLLHSRMKSQRQSVKNRNTQLGQGKLHSSDLVYKKDLQHNFKDKPGNEKS